MWSLPLGCHHPCSFITMNILIIVIFQGNPIKEVGWLKDGVNIGHSESILRIESVKKEDKGMYQVHLSMFFWRKIKNY